LGYKRDVFQGSRTGYYGEKNAAVASELAFLFEVARDWSRASDYFLIAASHASGVFANQEASALAHRGLEALSFLPDTVECAKQELALQSMVGHSLMMTKGYAHPEVELAFIRARELCLRLDDNVQLFRAQFGLAIVYLVRAEHQRAVGQAEQCLRLAESRQNASMLMQSHWVLGLSQFYMGEIAGSRLHFEQAIAIHDSEHIGSLVSVYGAVISRGHLARALLYLGFADQSQEMMNQAIARTERMSHPVGLADALALTAHLSAFHHYAPSTQETAAAIKRHAEGESLLKTGIVSAPEAERCFHQAIQIARQQQTKFLELRAVMSLARLWKELDKTGDAHQLLDGVYGWFTEGFDTPALKTAGALLKELSSEPLE
jgi:tetratricopeptide (TPR) repeat protein